MLKLALGAVGLVSVTLFLTKGVENGPGLDLQMPPMALRQQDSEQTTVRFKLGTFF